MKERALAVCAPGGSGSFDDKDVDNLIEYFRDKDRREQFCRGLQGHEMLTKIISPTLHCAPFSTPTRHCSAITRFVAMLTRNEKRTSNARSSKDERARTEAHRCGQARSGH